MAWFSIAKVEHVRPIRLSRGIFYVGRKKAIFEENVALIPLLAGLMPTFQRDYKRHLMYAAFNLSITYLGETLVRQWAFEAKLKIFDGISDVTVNGTFRMDASLYVT